MTNQDLRWGGVGGKFKIVNKKPGIQIVKKTDKKWAMVDSFPDKAKKAIVRIKPGTWNVQNLYFNPKLNKLYLGEADSGPTVKAFTELVEIDPVTNKSKIIKLPFNPMDIAFDLNGLIYMRTMNVLARFEMNTWKEVPFDYGTEQASVGRDGGSDGQTTAIVSGIMLPAVNAVCYHQGGMSVNANSEILVACHNRTKMEKSPDAVGMKDMKITKVYKPFAYPGRTQSPTSTSLHIWDKHGKVLKEDVIKGCPQTDGTFFDKDHNIYIMATPPRTINNKQLDDGMSSTLFKFKANKGRFLSRSTKIPMVLSKANYPKRSTDVRKMWALDYEWQYGGVGFAGFNSYVSGGCACWFARFHLDYFSRSFAPEPMQYGVSVLDKNGNLILRIGKYGNKDSKGPKSLEPLGGDEVGFFHPCFVTCDTDNRLFVADIGNERLISVKLEYHVNKTIPLK